MRLEAGKESGQWSETIPKIKQPLQFRPILRVNTNQESGTYFNSVPTYGTVT